MGKDELEILKIKSYLNIGLYSSIFFSAIKFVVLIYKIFRSSSGEILIIIFELIVVTLLLFGISKKSRICAVIFVAYFLADRIYTNSLYPTPNYTMLYLIAFGVTQLQGLRGVFSYHRFLKKA
jgi:DNA integrity scanning protein DisA with diadenylate cyclase activity